MGSRAGLWRLHLHGMQLRCDNSGAGGCDIAAGFVTRSKHPPHELPGVTWGGWGQCPALGDASQRNKSQLRVGGHSWAQLGWIPASPSLEKPSKGSQACCAQPRAPSVTSSPSGDGDTKPPGQSQFLSTHPMGKHLLLSILSSLLPFGAAPSPPGEIPNFPLLSVQSQEGPLSPSPAPSGVLHPKVTLAVSLSPPG